MFIGLLSDTHGLFSSEFRDFLAPVDAIWHAGDFGGGLDTETEIAAFNCEGMKILMTHIGGSPGHYYPEAADLIRTYRPDIFVCGHSHILKVMNDKQYNLLYINPGAAGMLGWHPVRTALRFQIDSGSIHDMEVFNLKK